MSNPTPSTAAPDFQLLFESAPDSHLVLAPDLTIVAVSDAYLRSVLAERALLIGRRVFDVFPRSPADLAATGLRSLRASLRRVLKHRVADTIAQQKYAIRRPDSAGGTFEERCWRAVSTPILGPDGAICAILHRVEDITESVDQLQLRIRQLEIDITHRTEEVASALAEAQAQRDRQDLALQAAQMGIWDLDLLHNSSVRSLRHDEIFGYATLQTHWNGETFFAHVFPQDQAHARDCFASAYATGILAIHCRIVWPDGSIHWIDARGQVYYDETHQPVRMLGVVLDITERKDLESRRDEFLAVASHELKTPVTVIKGMSELLLRSAGKRGTSEKELRALTLVNQQADRISHLVSDMLDVSRIAAGQLVVALESVDLGALLSDVVAQQQLLQPTHSLILAPCGPCAVRGNLARLEQVIQNLVANAIQYSPAGSSIFITMAQAADQVTVAVRDSGIGISADRQAQLFERFYQAQDQPARGLGLGLYIVKEIIAQHGGQIWLESAKDSGSTFSFSLPIEASHL